MLETAPSTEIIKSVGPVSFVRSRPENTAEALVRKSTKSGLTSKTAGPIRLAPTSEARWRSGDATDCKSVYTSSILVRASIRYQKNPTFTLHSTVRRDTMPHKKDGDHSVRRSHRLHLDFTVKATNEHHFATCLLPSIERRKAAQPAALSFCH